MSNVKTSIIRVLIWIGIIGFIWLAAYLVLLQKYAASNMPVTLAFIYAFLIGSVLIVAQLFVIPRLSFLNQSSQVVFKSLVYGAAFTMGYFPGWIIEILWKYSHKSQTDLLAYSANIFKQVISSLFSGKEISDVLPPELVNAATSIFAVFFLVIILSTVAGYIDSFWRKEKMIKQVQQNKIRFLQAQMQPHFLFNTLNSITSLISKEPEKAENLLIGLSDFFRQNMKYSQNETILLKDEISFLENYLNLHKARFGNKLNWHIVISPDCEEVEVPSLVLQPLIENAIKHGWPDREKNLMINISALFIHPYVIIEVEDDGVGFEMSSNRFPPAGHAIELLQSRLTLLYNEDDLLSIQTNSGEGTKIKIKINNE